MTLLTPTEAAPRLRALAERWAGNSVNERAAFQTWFLDFCEALGVDRPVPPTDDHRFELPVQVVERDGGLTTNFIDYWKSGHVAVEAKATHAGDAAGVTASARSDLVLRRAFGQVVNYVAHVPGTPPPYLVVVDVPKTLIVWDRWSGQYGDFGAGRRIALATLHERPDDIQLLQDILANPAARDPRGRAQVVTREIAGKLAELAAAFEDRGLDPERVARFLMRCVFCFFAEDVGLLPRDLFRRTLETARQAGTPAHVAKVLTSLWKTMDTGGMFGAELLHRFNGHFFQTVEALPLDPADVTLLIEAAKYDWSGVEPSIFGTLLVRALDPEERHRLGADYTPREYIERLVEPTVVEPIQERWKAVQAVVVNIERAAADKNPTAPLPRKDRERAVKELLAFHTWLRGLRFLDPACGSGNFLYVTMAAVKRIELEVLNEIARLSGGQQGLVLEEVHPRQFHGIEIKPWAREIAELTLWIGYHQFWRETHGGRTPPDPILEDTGTIECRDAVLAWDEIVHRPEKDRPDPTPRIPHPVTGELVPDPEAKLPYYEYVGARRAEWPEADFIIGNPPYVGNKRMRLALGDGYVEALREAWSDVPEGADLVMYWWWQAALRVSSRKVVRAGLITTNSIVQPSNRSVVSAAREKSASVIWAIPDHPWVESTEGAAVRVALTVLGSTEGPARWLLVDEKGRVVKTRLVESLNDDLSATADVARAAETRLKANEGLSFRGFTIVGRGFVLEDAEARELLQDPQYAAVIRPYLNGRDLAQRPRGVWIIDFGLLDEHEAAQFPRAFDIVRDRVRPERQANGRRAYRELWWRFAEARPGLRAAVAGLTQILLTPYVARHRYFVCTAQSVAPDDKVLVFALPERWQHGILSSRIHQRWAAAAGTRLGVGNDLTYNNPRCFEAFPFPVPSVEQAARTSAVMSRLDSHRQTALASDEGVTMTGMYNVVEKLRSGEKLTPKERAIHELAACGVLKDLHDELDRLVAEAYGWPWPMEKEEILERLVQLHDERVEEEKRGLIRWLRPEYQIPRFAPEAAAAELPLPKAARKAAAPGDGAPAAPGIPWPISAVEQVAALTGLLARGPATLEQAVAAFTGADRRLVARHLETLALMGEATVDTAGRYDRARRVA